MVAAGNDQEKMAADYKKLEIRIPEPYMCVRWMELGIEELAVFDYNLPDGSAEPAA